MAPSGAGSAADADRDPADQADAAARRPELITRLTRRRVASGLSQAGVAKLMGTSQPAVARLESGLDDVQLSTVSKYAEALGLSLGLVEAARAQAGASGAGAQGEAAEASAESGPVVIPAVPDRLDPDRVLTSRQLRVLEVIRDSVQRRGYPPSMREIGEAVGLTSASSVSYQLSSLQRKGYLRRDVGRPRTVEIQLPGQAAVPPEGEAGEDAATGTGSPEMVRVPVYSYLPAAGLALADQAIEDVFLLPRKVADGGKLFVLKAADEGMERKGIKPGDLVVVHPQSDADDGDIVVAWFEDQAIVRIFRQVGSHGWLVPSDPACPQIDGDKASIRGKVVALLARFG